MQPNRFFFVLLIVLALAVPAVAGAKLYKWTDADGRIHYSDRVPPEAAAREREVKTERGETLERVDAAKTREQLEAERRAHAEAEAKREAEAEVARRRAAADRTLLLTFSSTRDIERSRDDRVAGVDGQITLTRERLGKLQEQLEAARRQAANAERTGRGKPQELHARVRDLEAQIADYERFVDERQQERAAIIAKFNADLARFQELMAHKASEAAD